MPEELRRVVKLFCFFGLSGTFGVHLCLIPISIHFGKANIVEGFPLLHQPRSMC
ncbi:MAG: hypothetical protein UZ07_CHB004000188 [Chlorobi bacterium OLB7]|nr:MAG: hypothetical protein UZ07_CHB004000188 [Chlorobi bacterium OLB7]